MRYPEFPVFGFLAAALVLIPLPRLVRAGNIAGIALVFWIFQDCLVIAINTLIWSGNVRNSAPAWCELGELSWLLTVPLLICSASEQVQGWRPDCSRCIHLLYQ